MFCDWVKMSAVERVCWRKYNSSKVAASWSSEPAKPKKLVCLLGKLQIPCICTDSKCKRGQKCDATNQLIIKCWKSVKKVCWEVVRSPKVQKPSCRLVYNDKTQLIFLKLEPDL